MKIICQLSNLKNLFLNYFSIGKISHKLCFAKYICSICNNDEMVV